MVNEVLPSFHVAYETADHVVIGGGMWDLYYVSPHKGDRPSWFKNVWFESLSIETYSDLLKNEDAYYNWFSKMDAMCRRRANGCIWMGATKKPSCTSCSPVAKMWNDLMLKQKSMRIINRWDTTPPKHFVDKVHADNFVNIWHTHLLLEALCGRSQCKGHVPSYTTEGYCTTEGKGRKEWEQKCDIVPGPGFFMTVVKDFMSAQKPPLLPLVFFFLFLFVFVVAVMFIYEGSEATHKKSRT